MRKILPFFLFSASSNGLLVYHTSNNYFRFFNETAWTTIALDVSLQSISAQEGNADTSLYSHFICATDSQSLVIRDKQRGMWKI